MAEAQIAAELSRSRTNALQTMFGELTLLAVAAATVTLTASPSAVRLICLAVLMLVAGSALTQLMLGERKAGPLLADPAIRLPLTVVFGAAILLAVVFGLQITGVRIDTTAVTVGTAVVGAALVIGQGVRRSRPSGLGPIALIRPALHVTVSAAVLAAAVMGAIALQPKATESYTTLTFADPSWLSEPSQPAVAGEPVRVNWIMRAFGYIPDPGATAVEVRVDSAVLRSIAIDIVDSGTDARPGGPSNFGGSVTFAAPESTGLHRLSIAIYPHDKAAVGERAPVELTGWLKVSAR